uniref:GATA-type domain-containing protein n=1 Tax=Solanum lycopersicum TaxID=4081 RepID=A0A3Q7EQN3_SOLLC
MQSVKRLTILHGSSTYQANLFDLSTIKLKVQLFCMVLSHETRHWRLGPAEKPVLCNACGSRWRIRGTLQNYIPRHANRETQSNQLPAEMNPGLLARDNQRLEVGVEVSGQEGSSACLEEEMNSTPSLVSAGSSSVNFMQMEETNEMDKFEPPSPKKELKTGEESTDPTQQI